MDVFLKLAFGVFLYTNVEAGTRVKRLSLAEPMPHSYFNNNLQDGVYSFNYDVSDQWTGNTQYRYEDRYPNGTVTGAYGFVDAFGIPQRFRYVADQAGYRVFKENYFKPSSFYTTTEKPLDKFVSSTEPEITWSRPKRPNRRPEKGNQKNNEQRRVYNLIGPPSLYVPYY